MIGKNKSSYTQYLTFHHECSAYSKIKILVKPEFPYEMSRFPSNIKLCNKPIRLLLISP